MKPRGRSGETRPRFGEWVYFGAGVAPIWGFVGDWREWGLRVAWANLRFNLGYAIGGFTHAERN